MNRTTWAAAFPPNADFEWPDVLSGMVPQHPHMPLEDTVVALAAWKFVKPHAQSFFLSAPTAIARDVILSRYSGGCTKKWGCIMDLEVGIGEWLLKEHQVLEMNKGTWWNKTNIGLIPDQPNLLRVPNLFQLVFCKLRNAPQLRKQADHHLRALGLVSNRRDVVKAWLSIPGLGGADPKVVEQTWCTTFPPTEGTIYQPRCKLAQDVRSPTDKPGT
jgi:hypothetical protein